MKNGDFFKTISEVLESPKTQGIGAISSTFAFTLESPKNQSLGAVLVTFVLIIAILLHGKKNTLLGTVINEKNEPVSGASINEPGSIPCFTDEYGNFSLTLTKGHKPKQLVILKKGYRLQKLSISNSSQSLVVVLQRDV
jgi:hypothetical protein